MNEDFWHLIMRQLLLFMSYDNILEFAWNFWIFTENLSYTLAFANSTPPHPPNYFDLVSLAWKIYHYPDVQLEIKSHLVYTHCNATQHGGGMIHSRRGWMDKQIQHRTATNSIDTHCACLLGFYSTLNQCYPLDMLKEYLSNIWRVSACYSSQKRKITGFNPKNYS